MSGPQTPAAGIGESRKRLAQSPLNDKGETDIIGTVREMLGQSNEEMKLFISQQLDATVQTLTSELTKLTRDVETLQTENTYLRSKSQINEGRITRLEKVVLDLHEDIAQNTARSMRDNLVFSNIPELSHESNQLTMNTLREFLQKELRINPTDMNTIDLIRVHRLGPKGTYNRAIIAKVNERGKQVIWAHTKYLRGTKYSINVQLPRELSERRKQLVPLFKKAREQQRNVKWAGDKLVIDNVVHKVKPDSVKDINYDPAEVATTTKVTRAPPTTYRESTFQGAHVRVTSPDEVIPGMYAIYSDQRCARATHNIYAYRITSPGGKITEYYHDDGEFGAGRRLLNYMKELDITDRMVCVSRWYGGIHLGPSRFDHILEAAKQVLELTDSTHSKLD